MRNVEKQRQSNGKLGGITGKGFKPGQSGNPKGRPKHKTLMEIIRERLSADCANPSLDDIAVVFIRELKRGSFQYMKEYIEREEGKAPALVKAEITTETRTSKFDYDAFARSFVAAIRAEQHGGRLAEANGNGQSVHTDNAHN